MGAAQRQPPAAPSRSVVSEQASPGKAWKTKHSCTENMKTTRKIASSTVSNTRKLYPNAARWKRWSSGQQALPISWNSDILLIWWFCQNQALIHHFKQWKFASIASSASFGNEAYFSSEFKARDMTVGERRSKCEMRCFVGAWSSSFYLLKAVPEDLK